MKILQAIYYPGSGGSEEYILNLSKELRKKNHEIFFVYSEEGPLVKRMKETGAEIKRIKMRSPFDIFAIFNAYKYLKTKKIDVIQTHFLRENFIFSIAGKMSKVKTIFTTVHRIEKKTKTQELFQRIYSNFLDRYIAVHKVAKDYLLEEGIKEQKITVINNAVPNVEFYTRDEARKALGIKKDDFVVGSVGRVAKEKRYDVFIELAKNLKDYNFLVLGDGPEYENLKQKNDNENLLFYGYLDEAQRFMKAFDVFLLTSDVEVLPTVLLEAMLAKVPVISKPVGGVPEVLERGKNGILAEEKNLEKILRSFKEMDKKDIIENAYKKVKEEYSFPKMADEVVSLAQNI